MSKWSRWGIPSRCSSCRYANTIPKLRISELSSLNSMNVSFCEFTRLDTLGVDLSKEIYLLQTEIDGMSPLLRDIATPPPTCASGFIRTVCEHFDLTFSRFEF